MNEWYVTVCNKLRESVGPKQKCAIYTEFTKMQKNSSDDFVMIIRRFIAICIFFSLQNYFGWLLFVTLFLSFLIYTIILIIIY